MTLAIPSKGLYVQLTFAFNRLADNGGMVVRPGNPQSHLFRCVPFWNLYRLFESNEYITELTRSAIGIFGEQIVESAVVSSRWKFHVLKEVFAPDGE